MALQKNIKLKKKAAYISLLVGLGMFAAKISAFLLTGSSAIFSDAAESVVHVLATGMALFSIILSSKPADKDHLYGHGNVEYFSAGIEGMLILSAAISIIYFAVKDIIGDYQPSELDTGTVIIAFAGIINIWLGWYLISTGKKTNSLTLIADGKHVLTDSFTSLGVVAGLILVLLTDIYLLDPIVAILVAVNIIFTGYKLIRQSIGGLMNETDPETLNKISQILIDNKNDKWIDIHQLRFWTSAERIFIEFHLILPFYFTIKESHDEEEHIREVIAKIFPHSQIYIHLDYCEFDLCKMCRKSVCEFRKENLIVSNEWNSDYLIRDPRLENSKV
ncbi:MAG: cation diffusion facilitator family transporter [Ignavibacteria bacterium]|jgi:cation diffusion facilitator family transporter